ncbi:MAG: hypothetical protein SF182_19125 [Deltaproteobacteria bacterium]|nr:hypothetical protein [Deltaproteobacteria bacterium]
MSDQHWATKAIDDTALAALRAGLPPSALWSLLLDVLQARAAARMPADLLRQWERDGFVQPAPIDQRTLVALDGHLLAAAADFEALALAPLAPLGSCAQVGPTSQHKIVSALRGTEVVSDPTNVLALECARRLRRDPDQIVRLTTCHRCVRTQPFPRQPGFAPHFSIFALASGARERPEHGFSAAALAEHIAVHRAGLDRLERHGYRFPARRLTLLATAARGALADRVAALVADIPIERAALTHPYYDGLRFQISARDPGGTDVPLIDGGVFDWLARLASNRRLVLVASGMGAQLAAYRFRTAGSMETP